ncbi:hypothetical protein BSU04_20540 [Caballeronia sordidicola]|uniref:Uncharacterized protein n=1 Tax=Caballeronia sordidicola TaxID=196367 RepID=A0A226X110_CABSO|nr:hypothetical protein BSU04_20540 [Caballeronia sordidicola]
MIIGARCTTTQQEVTTWVGATNHGVGIHKTRLAFNDFKIVEQRRERLET